MTKDIFDQLVPKFVNHFTRMILIDDSYGTEPEKLVQLGYSPFDTFKPGL